MKAILSGSFDPVTVGHLDIIRRAAAMFDTVYAVVCRNSEKSSHFTAEERQAMLVAACEGIPNVVVDVCEGLLAAYTEAHGISVIVRGVRDASDMPYEMMLATINRGLRNHPETVFLPTKPEHSHLSSSFVRDMIRYGEPLEGLLPDAVIPMVRR